MGRALPPTAFGIGGGEEREGGEKEEEGLEMQGEIDTGDVDWGNADQKLRALGINAASWDSLQRTESSEMRESGWKAAGSALQALDTRV